jgi:preprotein translocase subunit SecF
MFGGHVLRGFTSAMMLGIVVGTYSSIYVSSSLLISLGLKAAPPPSAKPSPATGAERITPKG